MPEPLPELPKKGRPYRAALPNSPENLWLNATGEKGAGMGKATPLDDASNHQVKVYWIMLCCFGEVEISAYLVSIPRKNSSKVTP